MRRCAVDYWSFREDVSGFERIFSKHERRVRGRASPGERDPDALFSPPGTRHEDPGHGHPEFAVPDRKADDLPRGHAPRVLCPARSSPCSSCSSAFSPRPASTADRSSGAVLSVILLAAGLRALFFPLSRLERVQSLSVFSPAGAGFFSVGGLTRSPADIFLTSAAIALVVGCLTILARPMLAAKRRPALSRHPPPLGSGRPGRLPSPSRPVPGHREKARLQRQRPPPPVLGASGFPPPPLEPPLLPGRRPCRRLSRLEDRRPSFARAGNFASPSRARPSSRIPTSRARAPPLFSRPSRRGSWPSAWSWPIPRKRSDGGSPSPPASFSGPCSSVQAADRASALRTRSLIQDFLRNVVTSQEEWGNLLVRESIPEIEKRGAAISSFLKEPGSPDFAHGIWDRTLAARFNWYSGLEILDAEGNALSRFSLNIPRIYGRELSLPPSRSWSVTRRSAVSLGRRRDFLVAYKDWFEGARRSAGPFCSCPSTPKCSPSSIRPIPISSCSGPAPSLP